MRSFILSLSSLVLLLTSCQSNRCGQEFCGGDVVKTSYLHPYGVEIAADEWDEIGQTGVVIEKLSDGVTARWRYDEGWLDGESTLTFPYRDVVETILTYEEGKLLKEKKFFLSGRLREEKIHLAEETLSCRHYYENGEVRSEELLTANRLRSGIYYDVSSRIEARVEEFTGQRALRDDFGLLLATDTIEDGVVTSTTEYYANGMTRSIRRFKNGVEEGIRQTFLSSGEPNTIEEWTNGQQHGITELFQDGEKISAIPYLCGKREGMERRFDPKQKVVEEIQWQNDHRHGPTIKKIEGKTIMEWYDHGDRLNRTTFSR